MPVFFTITVPYLRPSSSFEGVPTSSFEGAQKCRVELAKDGTFRLLGTVALSDAGPRPNQYYAIRINETGTGTVEHLTK